MNAPPNVNKWSNLPVWCEDSSCKHQIRLRADPKALKVLRELFHSHAIEVPDQRCFSWKCPRGHVTLFSLREMLGL